MTEQSEYVELVRISDPVQADLLAAFLEDGDIEFQVVNRSGAGFMSQLIPRSANPVLFRVLAEDLERGKVLLAEYHALQDQPSASDDEDDADSDETAVGSEVETENGPKDSATDDVLEGEGDEISDWELEVDATASERD